MRRLGTQPVRTTLMLCRTATRELVKPRPSRQIATGEDMTWATGTIVEHTPVARLGLHVTAAELEIWRERSVRGPYRTPGDAIPNSPGDWERIEKHAAIFSSQPEAGRWRGPTHKIDKCVVQSRRWPHDVSGMPARLGAPEHLRDAAFHAMVARPPNCGAIVRSIKAELLWHTQQPALDFTNRSRYCLERFGRGYHPAFQISAWLRKLMYAFDYSRIAAPGEWPDVEEQQVLTWFASVAPWYMAQVDAHRRGMWTDEGVPTSRAEQIGSRAARPIWLGGPVTRRIQHRYNNHVNRFAVLLTDIGILTGDELLKDYGRRWIREFLKAAVYPVGGAGEFYRWDSPDKGHLQGWKYGMEMAGATLVIADHLARTGDLSGYMFGTTAGTSDTAGRVPDDDVTNGGPKTLLTTMQQLLRYVDEESEPPRYASWSDEDPTRRISSRDQRTATFRADDWLVLQGNVFYRDPYVRSIYLRARPGTPALPAEPKHGLGWIPNGDVGTFPAVNLMFAQMEGKVWPYPSQGT